MLYKKRVNIGSFLKKGEDIRDRDVVEITSEGQPIEGKFGTQDVFTVKLENGKEGNVSFNSTSINNMIDAFGEDSKNWIEKKVKIWLIRQNVQGKLIPVLYVSHPDAEITDKGVFVLPGKDVKTDDIPVINEEEDINPEDIPF